MNLEAFRVWSKLAVDGAVGVKKKGWDAICSYRNMHILIGKASSVRAEEERPARGTACPWKCRTRETRTDGLRWRRDGTKLMQSEMIGCFCLNIELV